MSPLKHGRYAAHEGCLPTEGWGMWAEEVQALLREFRLLPDACEGVNWREGLQHGALGGSAISSSAFARSPFALGYAEGKMWRAGEAERGLLKVAARMALSGGLPFFQESDVPELIYLDEPLPLRIARDSRDGLVVASRVLFGTTLAERYTRAHGSIGDTLLAAKAWTSGAALVRLPLSEDQLLAEITADELPHFRLGLAAAEERIKICERLLGKR